LEAQLKSTENQVIISGERRLLVLEETAVLLHKLPNFQARA
jgi:hypothetical protein